MITPLARRRPWKLARETVTLDRVSQRPAHPRRRPRLPARGRVRDLRRGDRRPRPGRQARRGARDPRRPLERREARLPGRALPGLRRPVPAPAPSRSRGSRSGAAAGGRTNARSGAPRAGTASPPSSPRRGAADPRAGPRNRRLRQGARSERPVRHRDQRLLGAGVAASRWARSPTTRRPASPGGWSGSTPTDFSHSTKPNSESTLALPTAVRTTAVQTRKEHHEEAAPA